MTNEQLKAHHRVRGTIKRRLTTFNSYIKDLEELGRNLNGIELRTLQMRSEKEITILDEFLTIQREIELICDDSAIVEEEGERERFDNTYYNVMARVECLLGIKPLVVNSPEAQFIPPIVDPNLQSITTRLDSIKLPTIQLPKYKGLITEWLEFRETYESLIHNNAAINKIQKFHYLKASLESNALQVIQAIEFSSDNYDTAWELLCNRYNNNQLLVHNHIQAIFDVQLIAKPSSSILRKLIDDVSKHLKSLNALQLPTDQWDVLIIHVVSNKLDKETLKHWEEYKTDNRLPTLNEFKAFLKSRADLLETLESREPSKSNKSYTHKFSFISGNHKCNLCKGDHLIYHCSNFLKLPVNSRLDKVNELQLCQNCLRTGHVARYCPGTGCRKCFRRHNTLLHNSNMQLAKVSQTKTVGSVQANNDQRGSTSNVVTKPQVTQSYTNIGNHSQTLLSTVVVEIADAQGKIQKCRALLDSGSQSNFISKSLFEQLNLNQMPSNLSIIGINQVASKVDSKCYVTIKSSHSNYRKTISCFILSTISDNLPTESFDLDSIEIPSNINLADPKFNESNTIDLLLGAALFWEIIREGRINIGTNKPVLQNTMLGWIISGSLHLPLNASVICKFARNIDLNDQLQKFWELEQDLSIKNLSIPESECELHFQTTFARNHQGRFIVNIPFKESLENLGDSRNLALKRFYSLERKLQLNQELSLQYNEFMKDYESLGHMTRLTSTIDTIDQDKDYFIPHHGVLKEDSLTTKLRVVFDASARTESGYSLNDLQHSGPSLQPDLVALLLRFRQHSVVFCSDITKMFRQILVAPEQRKYQRIWWRPNTNTELAIYELNTVTYGLTSAPYLAIRCLKQLASENILKYPKAAAIIDTDMYVDDVISGSDTEEEAIILCKEIMYILKQGGFELRKWASNKPKILNNIDKRDHLSYLQSFGNDQNKTLGLQWSPNLDILTYAIDIRPPRVVTKRVILSEIAQIFDPLGLVTPCIIISKIILQQLWSFQLSWDDEIPEALQIKWQGFRDNLPLLNSLKIPRHAICNAPVEVCLHGYSDASLTAYGACVYCRSIDSDGKITVRLICAKSKVAPLKSVTIPRLELCGAVLLSKLMSKIQNALTVTINNCYYWIDSQIVLCWIRSESSTLQTFVSNRIAEIQRTTIINNWRFVNGIENPADLASRGLQPEQLLQSKIWWNGPTWLTCDESSWPINESINLHNLDLPEIKRKGKISLVNTINSSWFQNYSDIIKLKRIVALCLRFINNCKYTNKRKVNSISVKELNDAFIRLIQLAQDESYSAEIEYLKTNTYLHPKNKLSSLTPFLDTEGILRVGGRLQHSQLPYCQKHPILLPAAHHLAKLLFRYQHIKLYHAGPQLILASTRTKFWVTNGRNLARKIVHECVRCFRIKPRSINPLMGNLPAHRVQPSFPFLSTGTDYAGPFMIRERRGRGVKKFKCYVCLFICLTTKALHLETVTDLTTSNFLAALNRFIARRGKPTDLYSDNGTTYVGANNELKEIYHFLKQNGDHLTNALANDSIKWHFIPPYSPNFGGIWEAAVKSTKHHLRRILGNTSLPLEEFNTVLVNIEGTLNSRPLTSMSSDPNDLEPLTPAHFLIGRPITSTPEPDLRQLNSGKLSNYQYIQQLQQQFWSRWSSEYLTNLQQRSKWRTNPGLIKKGALVLLKDDAHPPLQWKLGRVTALHPGADNVVRVISVQTHNGVMKRALSRVCPLPIEED